MIERFVKAIAKSSRECFLTPYSLYELSMFKLHLSNSGGFAIKPDGELTCLFSSNGMGSKILKEAIKQGANKLSCFDGYLPLFYAGHGFVECGRMVWDDNQAPTNWNTSLGKPDVVLMKLEGR